MEASLLLFNKCFLDVTSGNKKVKKSEYLKEGIIPVIDQGKNFIGGYTNDNNFLYKGNLPCIVFGDHSKHLKYIDFPFAIGADGVKILSTTELLDIQYGYYFLKSVQLPKLGYSRHFKYLKVKEVLVYPLEEQKRIGTFFRKIEKLIQKRNQSIELLDEYLKSLFLEKFGDPIINPKNFTKKKLDYFGNWKSGGTPPKKEKKFYKNGTIPWFSSGELNNVFITDSTVKITAEAIEKTSAKKVKANSLLIGMYDTAALKTSITKVDCSCNQAIAFSKIDKELGNPVFLLICLTICKDFFLHKRKGARQKNLNLSIIKSLKFINPPLELQNRFHAIYEKIELQAALINKSKEIIEELFNALIFQFFSQKKETEVNEIENLLNDNFLIKEFFETIDKSDFQSLEQYDIELERLRKILIHTKKEIKKNKKFNKGIIQILSAKKVQLRINTDYINEKLDEAT